MGFVLIRQKTRPWVYRPIKKNIMEFETIKLLKGLLVFGVKLYLKKHTVISPRPSEVPLLTYNYPDGKLFTGYRHPSILSPEYQFALDPRVLVEVTLRQEELTWWEVLIQGIATCISNCYI